MTTIVDIDGKFALELRHDKATYIIPNDGTVPIKAARVFAVETIADWVLTYQGTHGNEHDALKWNVIAAANDALRALLRRQYEITEEEITHEAP